MHRTLAIWSLMVVACTGPPDSTGLDGLDGLDGHNGPTGPTGPTGDPGAPGATGPAGGDGAGPVAGHVGDPPWGVDLSVLSVLGASGPGGAFQIGDVPSVTFSVLDDDGGEYEVSELAGVYFQLSGPTTHYQSVLSSNVMANVRDTATYNGDGTWTYADLPIPATYGPPPNDTLDLGVADGDLGGQPLEDGTYTLAAWAYLDVTDAAGVSSTQASNVTVDVLFGAATTLEPRSVVLAEDCAACHGDQFDAHGGSRRELGVCLTCHVDGAEDRFSATDPSLTPGLTVSFGSLVHRIHAGIDQAVGFVVAGYPADPLAGGFPDYNLVDFSDVVFPSWPMSEGNCAACHAGAVDGDVESRPTRYDCATCHDTIDFAQTDPLAVDYHAGGPQVDDTNCIVCHGGLVVGYHDDPREADVLWPGAGHGPGEAGIHAALIDAVNQDGEAAFSVGDTVTVRFTVAYDDGTAIPASFLAYSVDASVCPTVSGGATMTFAGPSTYLQRVLISASPSAETLVGSVAASSIIDADGVWTYTLPDPVPAVYPVQANDALLAGVALGDQVGLPLADGTYRLALDVYTAMWDDPTCAEGAARWREAAVDTLDVLVGGATVAEPHAVVTDEACEACHTNLEFHGATRISVDYCVTCHTAGAMDDDVVPLVTVDFPVMIHKIHASDQLENGYVIGEDPPYAVTFPRQDGGVAACVACHGTNEAYLVPSARACVTCHDSLATQAHASLNTDPTFGESCAVCHGAGSTLAVDAVHAWQP